MAATLKQGPGHLRSPHRLGQTIAQIAFANGFGDAAHFTRSFKHRYLATPREWRMAADDGGAWSNAER